MVFTASDNPFFQSLLSSDAFAVNVQFHTEINQGPFSSFTAFVKHLRSSLSISSSLLHSGMSPFFIHVRVLVNTFIMLQRDIFSWLSFSTLLDKFLKKSICFSFNNTDVRLVLLDIILVLLICNIGAFPSRKEKKLAIASSY